MYCSSSTQGIFHASPNTTSASTINDQSISPYWPIVFANDHFSLMLWKLGFDITDKKNTSWQPALTEEAIEDRIEAIGRSFERHRTTLALDQFDLMMFSGLTSSTYINQLLYAIDRNTRTTYVVRPNVTLSDQAVFWQQRHHYEAPESTNAFAAELNPKQQTALADFTAAHRTLLIELFDIHATQLSNPNELRKVVRQFDVRLLADSTNQDLTLIVQFGLMHTIHTEKFAHYLTQLFTLAEKHHIVHLHLGGYSENIDRQQIHLPNGLYYYTCPEAIVDGPLPFLISTEPGLNSRLYKTLNITTPTPRAFAPKKLEYPSSSATQTQVDKSGPLDHNDHHSPKPGN